MDIHETPLPGVGMRHDFVTRDGTRVGIVTYQSGRRDLVVYDRKDPDSSRDIVHLTDEEADALAEILGSARIAGPLAALQQKIEGLTIDWVPIPAGSRFDGRPLSETQARSRTGVSIVAVVRGEQTFPSPTPDFVFHGNDTLVIAGTTNAIRALDEILRG